MKKLFYFLVLLFFISCDTDYPSTPPDSHGRFVILYQQDSFIGGARIIQDTITGEKYLFYKCGYSGGLTHL